MSQRDKIDRTINRSLDMVERLEKLFANNGVFEKAVTEEGGDISWFSDVRENLKSLFSNIEELHMAAVSHLDMEEAAKPDFADIDGDGDKEESMKKAAKDKEKADESISRIRELAGLRENDDDLSDYVKIDLSKKMDLMKMLDKLGAEWMQQKAYLDGDIVAYMDPVEDDGDRIYYDYFVKTDMANELGEAKIDELGMVDRRTGATQKLPSAIIGSNGNLQRRLPSTTRT